ncbi:serine/threonine-protein kinase ATR [Anopheles cruzii]|uniref:serine/threonine-protein kinase ATR n=1 Tax=Anopheles cruzii TaxID=68878 RepID=UPI0022EC2913|nr:serine/threonine-protein kinase ATR [Anopheles cruzii]
MENNTVNDSAQPPEGTEGMWKTLITTLTNMVQNNSSNLEMIVNMIRTDITYDDPGLFPSSVLVTEAERLACRACNFWLINQLLQIATMDVYNSICSSYTRLQKEIVTACFLKQRWLALEISAKFVQLLEQLNEHRPETSGASMNVFHVPYDFATVHCEGCKFVDVPVGSAKSCRMLRMYSLQVLCEVISIIACESEGDVRKLLAASVRAALHCLSVGALEEKTLCVLFARKYLKFQSDALAVEYCLHTAVEVMTQTSIAIGRIKSWHVSRMVRTKHVTDFLLVLTDFYGTLNGLNGWLNLEHAWKQKLTALALGALSKTNASLQVSEQASQAAEKLSQQLVLFLTNLKPSERDADGLFGLIEHCPDVMMLLDHGIVEQVAITMDDGPGPSESIESLNVLNASSIWATLLTETERNPATLERAIALANIVNFNFQCRRNEADRGSLKECIFFASKLSLLAVDSLLNASGRRFPELVDLCFDVVHLSDFKLLDVEQQLTLLHVLFTPFEGTYLPVTSVGHSRAPVSEIEKSNSVCKHTLERLCALRTDHMAVGRVRNTAIERLTKLVIAIGTSKAGDKDGFLQSVLLTQFNQLLLSTKLPLTELGSLLAHYEVKSDQAAHKLRALQLFCCLRSTSAGTDFRVYQITPNKRSYECTACSPNLAEKKKRYHCKTATEQLRTEGVLDLDGEIRVALRCLKDGAELETRLAWATLLPTALRHCECMLSEESVSHWATLFGDGSAEVCQAMSKHADIVMRILADRLTDELERYEKCVRLLLENLLLATRLALKENTSYTHQWTVVRLIVSVAAGCLRTNDQSYQETLKHSVRMMLFFLLQPESEVTNEASLAVEEMCARQGVTPWNVIGWYRHDIIKLMTGLVVRNYCHAGIKLYQSLTIVSHTFGCRDPVEFVSKYYKLMMAMLVPWCLRFPKCEDLLREMAVIVRKDLVVMLSVSFLTIYTYLFISESADVTKRSIDYIIKLTGNSFFHLLHSDIKGTLSEILIYYHINAECVLHAIRSLLSRSTDSDNQVPTTRIAEYIAERFLGVLAYFEATLVDPDGERDLKSEALLSLGDIIRLLGGEHITPFRFKIIALLRTALALHNATLTGHCVKIWRIFVCTVDVRQLGPLLSTIVVTLEPLLSQYPEDVDYIFRYLVIENNSLLGQFIGDLFFLDGTAVANDVKKAVALHTPQQRHNSGSRSDVADRFPARLEELIRHCNHENLTVRAHALAHLRRLCEDNRAELNEAIVGQHQRIAIGTIATLVETLIRGLGEQDTNLQLRAAECFGELGALAPGHLPPNYAPQGLGFALGVHSDAFAIIALRELCQAYQRQKDSKFVDSFSLAIQEILTERGVSPATGKKLDVWETIPERLRPIMEPLLTSCYTTVAKAPPSFPHPVFASVRSSCEWSYQWASQMIESIGNEVTRNLLRAFKPSLRCDGGTMSLLLPYVLLHALQLGAVGDRQRVAEELQAVFDAAVAETDDCSGAAVLAAGSSSVLGETLGDRRTGNVETFVVGSQGHSDSSATELALQCAKFAFGLFDFLERWKRQQLKVGAGDVASKQQPPGPSTSTSTSSISLRPEVEVVDAFLNRFDSDLLAKVNFKCHEYARALQYLEQRSIGADRGQRLQAKLSFLAEIYSRLGDTDSIEGVMALKATEPTLAEQILYHNATGRLQEAVACYERQLQVTGLAGELPKLEALNNMIECYLRLDQPETALLLAESLLARFCDTVLREPLQEIQAEPLYRLGRFEELEELLSHRGESSSVGSDKQTQYWGVICGSLIVKYRQTASDEDGVRFEEEVQRARLDVIRGGGVGGTGRTESRTLDELGTYEKRYEQVLKLHIIGEFEKCGLMMRRLRLQGADGPELMQDVQQLIDGLNARLEVLQPNASTLEPIISLRRILLRELKLTLARNDPQSSRLEARAPLHQLIDRQIGELWMKSTELASRANMYQQALLYILHAESYRPPDLFIKNAKLLWDRRDMTGALKVLERGVNEILSEGALSATDVAGSLKTLSPESRLIYAEGKRLIAAYNAEASNISTTLNHRYFKEAVVANPESEATLVHLAQYVDKLYASCPANEQDSQKGLELLLEVMTSYGKSMMYGSTYIYQSMPRLLSIWLDCTAKILPSSGSEPEAGGSSGGNANRKIAQHMNKMAHKFRETLSPYFFFTAFSQLISRVAHPSHDTYQVLKSIIVKLMLNYPQQTLWMMLSVYKSSYANRVRRCVEIFNDRHLQVGEMPKLIKDFNIVADRFIELTNKEIPGGTGSRSTSAAKVTVSSLVKILPKLLTDSGMSRVLIPIQSCMQLVLDKGSGKHFKPYPMNAIYMQGIEEEVTVLNSLQKPRKITLRGHNGRCYTMMMKPKDDLRKDFRLMEFNAVVKQYLAQDPDAKLRRLHIRTYAVLPLNEECGIIEWISNLNTFRGIVCTYYKQRGAMMGAKELRMYNYTRSEPLARKRDAFLNVLLPRHPAVFGEWFRDCFPNPHNWFQARSSYIKTTAVISIVGYILGLGDRHGENILFDSSNGDTVHVDFNCLFNRGETFQIPECVPFRLTHNMVDAMGPLGVEGLYRKCCEIVLRVLQNQTPTLMSVLRPFVYDPIVSWSKVSSGSGTKHSTERTDSAALQNVLNIEERLKGFVKINGKTSHMPLSIEGQVSHLIKEATDTDNLAQMYIGWSPFI